jgi:hypothetical protein
MKGILMSTTIEQNPRTTTIVGNAATVVYVDPSLADGIFNRTTLFFDFGTSPRIHLDVTPLVSQAKSVLNFGVTDPADIGIAPGTLADGTPVTVFSFANAPVLLNGAPSTFFAHGTITYRIAFVFGGGGKGGTRLRQVFVVQPVLTYTVE